MFLLFFVSVLATNLNGFELSDPPLFFFIALYFLVCDFAKYEGFFFFLLFVLVGDITHSFQGP